MNKEEIKEYWSNGNLQYQYYQVNGKIEGKVKMVVMRMGNYESRFMLMAKGRRI